MNSTSLAQVSRLLRGSEPVTPTAPAPRRSGFGVKESIICTATTLSQAEQIIEKLQDAGVSQREMSVVCGGFSMEERPSDWTTSKAPEGAVLGIGSGLLLGAGVGWILASLGGLSANVAVASYGTLLPALSGALMVAVLGGVAGGFVGWCIPAVEMHISVSAIDAETASRITSIFQEAGARGVCTAVDSR